MTKSTITREQLIEKIKHRIAVTEKYPHLEEARIDSQIFKISLAAMDCEPVAYIFKHPAGRLFWALTDESNKGQSDVMPVYAAPQPPPVVPEEWAISDAVKFCKETGRQDAGTAMDAWNACRAAMLQAGNSPVTPDGSAVAALTGIPMIPDGYVMVPVEPNGDMLAAAQDAYGETDGDIASTLRAAMLAAAPQSPGSEPATVSGKWIPVCERVPTKQDGSVFLTWNGQYIGKELFLMGSFQCLKPEIITHWMPLPAAPQEVNHG